jgi:hypothetical protein
MNSTLETQQELAKIIVPDFLDRNGVTFVSTHIGLLDTVLKLIRQDVVPTAKLREEVRLKLVESGELHNLQDKDREVGLYILAWLLLQKWQIHSITPNNIGYHGNSMGEVHTLVRNLE